MVVAVSHNPSPHSVEPLSESEAGRLCAEIRWVGGQPDVCPRCGSYDVCGQPCSGTRPPTWGCRGCRRSFSVKTGTAMHGSKLGLAQWVAASRTWWNGPGEIRRALNVSYPTARRVAHVLAVTETPAGDRRLAALLRLPPSAIDDDLEKRRRLMALIHEGSENALAGLTRCEREVLRGLRCLTLGGTPGRIAEVTGHSAGHIRRCLRNLSRRGYVKVSAQSVPCGYGQAEMHIWELTQPAGRSAALMLPQLHPPPGPSPTRVPTEFWWTFWSGISAANMNLADPSDALMTADNLIGSGDLAAQNWALVHLPLDTLRALRSITGYQDGPKAQAIDAVVRERSGRQR